MKLNMIVALLLGTTIAFGACTEDEIEMKQTITCAPFVMPQKAYVLAEQSRNAIVIRDAESGKNIWSWDPEEACVPMANQSLFINPSEVKPVYNGKYILMTASGGAVALIRIADKKLVFYADAGANPHSAELLPDGNIVTAESRNGEINTFYVNPNKVYGVKANTRKLGNAHNVVWDYKRGLLFATATYSNGNTALYSFKYDGNTANPKLINQSRIFTFTDENGGHDLFPVYGEDNKLWLTAASAVYKFDITNPASPTVEKVYNMPNIKSISNSSHGVIMLQPTEEWWAEGLIDKQANELFTMKGAKLYKGRWMVDNTFSYPETHVCPFE